MEEILEAAKPLISPINKLIDVVACGVGKIYEPTHIKRMAKAKAFEIKAISEAMENADSIPMIYEHGDITADTTEYKELVKRTQLRLFKQEVQKQENTENIIGKAYLQLEEEEKINSEPLDSDWINRFFNYAGDISNEKMQELWASLLAGEIKRPSTFSLRTLETLHNLTQKEAELFQRASSYFMYNQTTCYIPYYNALFSVMDISYSDILKLEECGLINSAIFLFYEPIISKVDSIIARNNFYSITAETKHLDNIKIQIPFFPLTHVGNEIIKFLKIKNDENFIKLFAQELQKTYFDNIHFHLYKIKTINSEKIEHINNFDLLKQNDN